MRRALSLLAVLTTALVAVVHVPTAAASTSVGFEPRSVLGPGVPRDGSSDQNVVELGQVSLRMSSTQTAYIVSVMRVNSATIRTLFDNEVVCRWAGGSKNMVMGQNVYKKGGTQPEWEDVTLTTRFLVHPGVAADVTCTAYLRTASLGYENSTVYLAGGSMRFANTSVENDTRGEALQKSTSQGVIHLNTSNPDAREPLLPMFDLAPGVKGLSVFGDNEYMVCHPNSSCDKAKSSRARFTLLVNQWKADGSVCHQDSSASATVDVPYYVHHIVVPLHKPNFEVRTGDGCIPRVNAYVRVQWLGGETGGIQGTALNLTDSRGSTSTHDSDMSHIFAVPYR
ncbi:hypothetical protein C8D88_104212 [Lentzea atacamensis]|uniref:Uncharacterized protein n=1 Tax=Lentzea atacamensis TaxID=531938 RepID=A0A316I0J4_9PSEU|nr:hypothetical protein [Lentzea atacamensis]PWK87051.1 hypothetical protein C8D88_104212 [Lentzea atacamensis]